MLLYMLLYIQFILSGFFTEFSKYLIECARSRSTTVRMVGLWSRKRSSASEPKCSYEPARIKHSSWVKISATRSQTLSPVVEDAHGTPS